MKVPGLERKTLAKCLDGCPDFVLDEISKRALRIGVKLHGKWLKENGLNKVANWRDKEEGYKQAFALVREVLQLDKAFRTKQLRAPSVAKLNLPETAKTLLRYHLGRNYVREHPMFLKMSTTGASKAYSASRLRVLEATGIPFEVDYGEHLKVFTPPLGKQLVYPGEYRPREEMAPFVFSRVSVEQAMTKLAALTGDALKESAHAVDEAAGDGGPHEPLTAPTETAANVPLRRRYSRGISGVPVDPHAD